jgi:hypothetical protein
MPTSLQYPLERSRGLQQKWARRQQGATASGLDGFTIVAITIIPPRDTDDDADNDGGEQNEPEEDREPAVIREPDNVE